MILENPALEFYDAIARRDQSFVGRFLYGVRTTGVFCLPTCPSRQPKRENVEFFADAQAACTGGYRPCKRCRPDRGDSVDERILQACRIIEANLEDLKLKALAAKVGLSETYFQRRFKKEVGVSPRQYALVVKEQLLRANLKRTGTVTRAIQDAGFDSASAVYAQSVKPLGMTPRAFAGGAETELIRFAIVQSALGWVLVASTARGICRVDLDAQREVLEQRVHREFPKARFERADDSLESATSLLVSFLAGQKSWPLLPVDVRATAFQSRVWEALRTIVSGKTLTYGELAAAIGSPKSVRAVAHACASNPIALLIPCHRIVPASGGIGGYRWGQERKAALLALEESAAP
ncbi:MAG: methylated-DNA--[protein]-cysteine S-methyltransferase [Candidatus Eremiobacteraeota bacterium]|nr:methylated-DNA--[protein]-cysteine S-methyltransferase [Candidatus Eremiobacteraeota bacterium]